MKTLLTASLVAFSLFTAQAHSQPILAPSRALIIVNELDSTGIPELAPLYSVLEDLTNALPNLPVVNSGYREIHTLRNNNATLAQFRTLARQLALRPEIRAIDVFMVLHGKPGELKFRDGLVGMTEMVSFMNEADNNAEQVVVTRTKRKLRMLYNTSCFGASHRTAFRNIGFDVVSGSIGVNANSEVEYPSFLALWNLNSTFGQAIAPTNTPAALLIADGPLVATGVFLNNFLKHVNSKKLFSGNTSMRISSPPQ